MALGLTQPLTEMSTRNISWGKGGRCLGLTKLPSSCADYLEIWEPHPPGNLRACPGLYRNCFTSLNNNNNNNIRTCDLWIGLQLFNKHNRMNSSNNNNFISLLILYIKASHNYKYRSMAWLSVHELEWMFWGSRSDGVKIFFSSSYPTRPALELNLPRLQWEIALVNRGKVVAVWRWHNTTARA